VLSSSWDGRPFGHNRHRPKIGGGAVSLLRGSWVSPHLTQCGFGRGYTSTPSGIFDPSSRLATTDMGRKLGVPLWRGGAGSPSNIMWPGLRPTSIPSFILIRPTVWPQYTNVTDRTDRQRSDSIGWTVLQTVAQKRPSQGRPKIMIFFLEIFWRILMHFRRPESSAD